MFIQGNKTGKKVHKKSRAKALFSIFFNVTKSNLQNKGYFFGFFGKGYIGYMIVRFPVLNMLIGNT